MSNIQTALLGAMKDICKIGIGKNSQASNYRYRGIDAAMNEMSPILVNNGITVTPRYSELSLAKYERSEGKFSHCVTVKGSFTFTAEDGTFVVAEAYGESIDAGDKATIKAQTVAFRTVLFQQFIVPLMSMDSELDGGEQQQSAPGEALGHAEKGVAAYEAYFKGLSKEGRHALASHHEELKRIAAEVDKNATA